MSAVFSGCSVAFVGKFNDHTQAELGKMVEDAGGQYTKSVTNATTHVVLASKKSLATVRSKATSKSSLHLVSRDWFDTSLQSKKRANEQTYLLEEIPTSSKKQKKEKWKHKDEGIDEATSSVILKWVRRTQAAAAAKPATPNDSDEDIVGDPLLVIQWNPAGLAHRQGVNAAHTKAVLLGVLTGAPNSSPEPPAPAAASDTVFRYASGNDIGNALALMGGNAVPSSWCRHFPGNPDVCRAYRIMAPKKGEEVLEELWTGMFNT